MPELLPCAPGSPEWLAARRQGVTATDIVTILGLSSWSSPYSLFWQKMGQVPETPDNDRFRLRRELEDYVVTRWLEDHDDDWLAGDGHLWRSTDRPWQMATLDRLVSHDIEGVGPLEVKTWADADQRSWGKGMVYDDDGPLVYDDQVPPAVRAQVLWQMDVMDVAVGHVGVVFLPSGEFRSYIIDHRADCMATCLSHEALSGEIRPGCCIECHDLLLMRAAGEEFMQRLRLELPAPDPDASAVTLAAVKARFARQPDKQAEVSAEIWDDYARTCEIVKAAEDRKRKFEIELREQAGEASVYTVDGQPVARRIVYDAPVKAHTRHLDYLKRIKTEADSE